MKTKKKNIIPGIVLVSCMVVLLMGVGYNPLSKRKIDKVDAMVIYKENFMDGCVYKDLEYVRVYCNCAFNEMVKAYGDDEMIRLGAEFLETKKLPTDLNEVIKPCIDDLKLGIND